ncbi:MAG: hypothetical protein JWQ88_2978 [Rhodoferax sp.]|nr:hypothetical protein [Rhodoferax sp.]
MRLTLAAWQGEARALHPKLLPDAVGTLSRNQNPVRGDLRPWHDPLAVATVPAGRQTIYRMGRDAPSDSLYWLSWTGVVHAVRGMIGDDTTERTYYTGDGVPKWTDNTIALASTPYPTAWRQLGVPVPLTRITLATTGGVSATNETRDYTYTYVTAQGEESAPAPVSSAWIGPQDATIALSGIATAPAGAYTINRVRIYRTQSGQSGDTEFYFLREIVAGTATSTDDGRSLGEVLPTDGWLPPPSDLRNLTAMWNGMVAAISGNAVRYAIAYKPYAWPIAFETLPPDAKPVALAVFGQRLLVLTTGKPLLVAGTSPDSLDEQPLEIAQSCVAGRGVVSFGHGVAWPCPDGLAYFGEGGAKLLTAGVLTRDDWQAMNPAGMVAAMYEGSYICFFTDAGAVRRGFLIDPLAPAGIYYLDTGYAAVFFDLLQDHLYVLDAAGSIKKWDAGAALMTARFVSKVWQAPLTNFAAGRVVADLWPVTVEVTAGPLTAAQVTALVARMPAVLSAPTTTTLKYTKIVVNRKPFRLPSGFTATDWQIGVSSAGPVQQVAIASAMGEFEQ